MKGFVNFSRFLALTLIMLFVGALDIYYFLNEKWLMGILFLLLFLLHLYLICSDCGAIFTLDGKGARLKRPGRKSIDIRWDRVAEWGVAGTGMFTDLEKRLGRKYVYFSENKLSEKERFDMCLHWPPKDKVFFAYSPKRLRRVMLLHCAEPVYYNMKPPYFT